MEFFFYDVSGKRAPEFFVTQVLSSLVSACFLPDEVIVDFNEKVSDLIFIMEGTCSLDGSFEKSDGLIYAMTIVRLP